MKDKRQCSNNMNYPIYQQPMMIPPMGYPMYQGGFQPNMMGMMNNGINNNTYEQQINNLEQQINLLDKRVTRLENLSSNNINNKYNDSNYYMV